MTKRRAAGLPEDLGQAARVPERVGQPADVGAVHAELPLEELAALDELADEGLAARHVRVGLDPHAADGQEPALLHVGADAREEVGRVLLQPRELLRRRHREAEQGIGVEQVQHVRDRPCHLAPGLPERPEPSGVDVGVADGADAVAVRGGGHVEGGREHRPRAAHGRREGAAVEHVEAALDPGQQGPAAGRAGLQLGLELQRDLQVGEERDDRGVAADEVHALEPVLRVGAGGRGVAEPGRAERDRDAVRRHGEDDRVRGRLDVEVQATPVVEHRLRRDPP